MNRHPMYEQRSVTRTESLDTCDPDYKTRTSFSMQTRQLDSSFLILHSQFSTERSFIS